MATATQQRDTATMTTTTNTINTLCKPGMKPPLPSSPRHVSTSPSTASTASAASAASTDPACVICMDRPKNISMSPCNHTHCCLDCFHRMSLHTCPICRTPVLSILHLDTGVHHSLTSSVTNLPTARLTTSTSLLSRRRHQTHVNTNSTNSAIPPTFATNRTMSTPLLPRRHAPRRHPHISVASTSPPVYRTSAPRPSLRPSTGVPNLPASKPTTVPTPHHRQSRRSSILGLPTHRRHAQNKNKLIVATPPPLQLPLPSTVTIAPPTQTIVLLGQSRKTLVALARCLVSTFPPPPSPYGTTPPSLKSTIVLNGQAIRLVLIESPHSAPQGDELVMRIQRHAPSLVLLVADYHDVTSFEAVVRIDMDVLLHSLRVKCVWVLVRSAALLAYHSPKRAHTVSEEDVRAARHFMSSPRHTVLVSVDGAKHAASIRKLSAHIYRHTVRKTTPPCADENADATVMERTQLQLPPEAMQSLLTDGGRDGGDSPPRRAKSLLCLCAPFSREGNAAPKKPLKSLKPSRLSSLRIGRCLSSSIMS